MIRFFVFLLFIAQITFAEETPLPGRLGSPNIYTASFGKNRMFFYMTQDKHDLAKDFIQDVNTRMLHTVTEAELDCPVNEVTPIATTDPLPVGYNQEGKPLYVDQKGSEIFIEHAQNVRDYAEKALGINIFALSQEMSLIMNYDANKFHKDQCPVQYKYLQEHPLPIPRYTIFQDLTLINWEMGKNTISGTILEDSESEDSFILCFSDSEVVCNVYTEPARYLGPNQAPDYPGADTLSPHSPIPPIDRKANTTVGSGKGKRISVAVRGLVRTEEIDDLEARSKPLPVGRPNIKMNSHGKKDYIYSDKLMLKEICGEAFSVISINDSFRLKDKDQVEIYASSFFKNEDVIEKLSLEFQQNIDPEEVEVRHLIKRGEGFSQITQEDLGINGDYIFYIINNSSVPETYRQYPLGEDLMQKGFPWVQLYHFPKDRVMRVSSKRFGELVLTPIHEIMFRDGIYDMHCSHPNDFFDKFVTILHIIAVPLKN